MGTDVRELNWYLVQEMKFTELLKHLRCKQCYNRFEIKIQPPFEPKRWLSSVGLAFPRWQLAESLDFRQRVMCLFKYSKHTVQNSLSTYIKKNLFDCINPFTSCKCMNGSQVPQKGRCYIETTTIQIDTLRNAISLCQIRGLALDEQLCSHRPTHVWTWCTCVWIQK